MVPDMIINPGIDGWETCRKILETQPGGKAVIASGYFETKSVGGAQKLGAGAYIQNPSPVEKIVIALRNQLGVDNGSVCLALRPLKLNCPARGAGQSRGSAMVFRS